MKSSILIALLGLAPLTFTLAPPVLSASRPSQVLLDLAEDNPTSSMQLDQRFAAFPHLSILPRHIDIVLAVSDIKHIRQDWRRVYAPTSANEAGHTSGHLAIACSSEALFQWLGLLESSQLEHLVQPALQAWSQRALPAYQSTIKAASADSPSPPALTEPLYISATIDPQTDSIPQILDKDYLIALLTMHRMSVTHEERGELSIITVDLEKSRADHQGDSLHRSALLALEPLQQLHLIIGRKQNIIGLTITPSLDAARLPDSIESSLLATSKLNFLNGRLETQPYALAWLSPHLTKACSPAQLLSRLLTGTEFIFEKLAEEASDTKTQHSFRLAASALHYNRQALLRFLPNYGEESSLLIWSDRGLQIEYTTGVRQVFEPGQLTQLDIADDPRTLFYSERTRLSRRETGMGLVNFVWNCSHIIDGFTSTLSDEKRNPQFTTWDELRTRYFPIVVQFTTALCDIMRGVSSAGGILLSEQSQGEGAGSPDWLVFAPVDSFAPLSSGWSQVLTSTEKFYEIRQEHPLREPLYTSMIVPESDTILYTLTPPSSQRRSNRYVQVSKDFAAISSHLSHIQQVTNSEKDNVPFTGSVAFLKVSLLDRLFEGSMIPRLSTYFDCLYAVLTQRRGKLILRATLSPAPAASKQS